MATARHQQQSGIVSLQTMAQRLPALPTLALTSALYLLAVAAITFMSTAPTAAQAEPAQPPARYVATTGTDAGPCTDLSTPCRTIQYAVGFADAVQLDRLAVIGYSAGGAYVAACAWKIPQQPLLKRKSSTCSVGRPPKRFVRGRAV
jgi:hypothetical protein